MEMNMVEILGYAASIMVAISLMMKHISSPAPTDHTTP